MFANANVALACCIIAIVSVVTAADVKLINKNVQRVIDITSQLVKINTKVTIENAGPTPVTKFSILFEPNMVGNVAHISVKNQNVELEATSPDGREYIVTLPQSLAKDSKVQITYDVIATNALLPFPSNIQQKDKQLVQYFGNAHYYSPYPTEKQTTKIVIPSSQSVQSYTKFQPVIQTDTSIAYGPFANVGPSSQQPITVHFENNAPFLMVTEMTRSIEISHWGSIAIEERINIVHSGAKLSGPFSRYDFQREVNTGLHCVKSYKTRLPSSANNIYYRDTNGNISTSHVRMKKDSIELELRPRFPLFGGWKTSYTLGYNMPSYKYLFKAPGNQFLLKIKILDHIFNNMHVDDFRAEIILPVGVTNVDVKMPYDLKRMPDTIVYKYMDNLGRIVMHFNGKNLVEQHMENVEITYQLNPLIMLHKPILLSVAFYTIFIIAIIYVRLDFSIHSNDVTKKDA